MRIEPIGYAGEDDSTEIYSFKVNMDNAPLLNEIKHKRLDHHAARGQFLYGNVLIGLCLLLDDKKISGGLVNGREGQTLLPVEERAEITCRAIAPFLLALTSLGAEDLSDQEEVDGLEEAG